jgi:hypothetical protein
MSSSASPDIVTNGLVLCLDAADRKSYPGSGTVWNDRSSNNNHGTLINGPTFSGINGGSIVFDGSNDFVSSNYMPPTGTNPRTVSIWFNPDIIQNKNLLGYGTAGPLQMWDILLYTGSVQVHLYGSDNVAITPYQINKWQNIVFTFTYPTITAYMDGILKNSYTNSAINTGTGNSLSLSKGVYSPYSYFDGLMSNVQIYNRALSEAEIKQNFKNTKSKFNIL